MRHRPAAALAQEQADVVLGLAIGALAEVHLAHVA
jgi:hypothetical protein